jgi:lipid A oxidase
MSRRSWASGVAIAALCLSPLSASAETQLSFFGGANWNFSSDVSLDAPGVQDGRSVDWDGGSFSMPPYWGVRGTYWLGRNWGVAVDYIHAKALADIDFVADATYDRLEFTDGNNLLLFELLYRFSPTFNGTVVPYVGVGAGVTIPHVEVTLDPGVGGKTYEYQLAGPAAQLMAGLEYKLSERWSVFTEFKLSYSSISADLTGGGTLETDLWSPQLAIGVTYRFGQ